MTVSTQIRRSHFRTRVMFQIHPIHVPSRAIVVRVNQFVREHVFHLRPRLNLVIAQAYPFSRHESADDLLVTLLDVEESLIDGAPGLLELFEQEPNHRVTKGDIFQLGRAFFRRHLYDVHTHTMMMMMSLHSKHELEILSPLSLS